MYFFKTPWWLKLIYSNLTWDVDTKDQEVFLTFDDGPHPTVTPFVLDTLKQFEAKATFFCIGKNVLMYPDIYNRIVNDGHSTGNHTHDHLNGWKTDDEEYLQNILQARQVINSKLFRPPYGRIKKKQVKLVSPYFKIIMWDVLSGDFDTSLTPEKSLHYVTCKTAPGSIIVFHDSEKAFPILKYVLPKALEFFSKQGYSFKALA